MGGRSSVSGLAVTVFGASGFIGRHVVSRLGRMGTLVVVPHRGDDYDIQPMKVMGDLGQINFARFHLRNYASIVECVKYSDVVINLIAQDRRTINFTMRDVNVEGAVAIARACREAKVPRLIHVSCMRAFPDAVSEYSRSKAEGEARVREEHPDAVVVRPATIFGTQDRLINGIGQFLRLWPGIPVLGDGGQLRYPLHILDIADALVLLARTAETVEGRCYVLHGPKGYTMRRLAELVAYAALAPSHITSLPPWAVWMYGKIFPEIRKAPFPYDTILQMAESERLPERALGMRELGFARLQTVEGQMLSMVRRYRRTPDFGSPLVFPEHLLSDSTLSRQP